MADGCIILLLELKLLDKYKNAEFLTATEKTNDLAIITYFPRGHCRKGQGSRGKFLTKTQFMKAIINS